MNKKVKKYQVGGLTKTYTDKAEYDKALQAYNDSLNLFKGTVKGLQYAKESLGTHNSFGERINYSKPIIENPTTVAWRTNENKINKNILPIGSVIGFKTENPDNMIGGRYYDIYKKPVVKPEFKETAKQQNYSDGTITWALKNGYKPVTKEIEEQLGQTFSEGAYYNPTASGTGKMSVSYFSPILAKGTLEQEVKPTMAQGKMESEVKPITELMMPSGSYMQKDEFIKRYGEKPWLKATGQKFQTGGKKLNTLKQQFEGYNNPSNQSYDFLDFPGTGKRTFVPTYNNQPILIQDDNGTKLLTDTPVITQGNVREKPLNLPTMKKSEMRELYNMIQADPKLLKFCMGGRKKYQTGGELNLKKQYNFSDVKSTKQDRINYLKNNPDKYTVDNYLKGISEPGLENPPIDPIDLINLPKSAATIGLKVLHQTGGPQNTLTTMPTIQPQPVQNNYMTDNTNNSVPQLNAPVGGSTKTSSSPNYLNMATSALGNIGVAADNYQKATTSEDKTNAVIGGTTQTVRGVVDTTFPIVGAVDMAAGAVGQVVDATNPTQTYTTKDGKQINYKDEDHAASFKSVTDPWGSVTNGIESFAGTKENYGRSDLGMGLLNIFGMQWISEGLRNQDAKKARNNDISQNMNYDPNAQAQFAKYGGKLKFQEGGIPPEMMAAIQGGDPAAMQQAPQSPPPYVETWKDIAPSMKISSKLKPIEYKGRTHKYGGINVSDQSELEHGEYSVNLKDPQTGAPVRYIFSAETGFAAKAKKIMSDYGPQYT